MAQHKGRQGEWPTVRGNPTAFYLAPDCYFKSDRPVAGPLRMGTEPRVGPSGAVLDGNSDFGVDRTSPRDFDPIGTVRNRNGDIQSGRISKQLRGR